MDKAQRFLTIILCALSILPCSLTADTNAQHTFNHGKVELLVGTRQTQGSPAAYAAVRFTLEDGWHVYSAEPGDVGLPTEITWQLPSELKIGKLEWPTPHEFTTEGLKSFGYERGVTIVAPLIGSAPNELPGKKLAAKVSWAICKDECIPGEAQLSLTITPQNLSPSAAHTDQSAPAPMGLLLAIGAGLFGGFLLNFMPCVFPVLSLKLLSLVGHGDARNARLHAASFSAGVILSFLALAGGLMALRATGEKLGWGFQFQSPLFVAGMVIVLLLVSLNLMGVFEIGMSIQTAAGRADRGAGLGGAFLSGVLATAVATPCTAPVMGTAVAVALARPVLEGLLIFCALGVGMAAPFALICSFPRLRAFLPRPGAWMNTLKQALAFPMFASVIWLLWVLRTQVGSDQTLRFELALVLLSLGAWIYGQLSSPLASALKRRVASLIFLAAIALTTYVAWPLNAQSSARTTGTGATSHEGLLTWERFSRERLAELRAAGTPVLVDFSAAWCLICQLNHKTVFQSEAVARALQAKKVILLQGDWTSRDPELTSVMSEYGRDGVPLDLLFGPGASAPEVLPSLLTSGALLSAIDRVVTTKG